MYLPNTFTLLRYALFYINVHQHASVASAFIIKVFYENTDNI
jgi:hypothetical protein